MGEFTSAEDAIAELYDATASDPYDDTQDALRDHLQDARVCILSELTALRAENARLRACVDAVTAATDGRIGADAAVTLTRGALRDARAALEQAVTTPKRAKARRYWLELAPDGEAGVHTDRESARGLSSLGFTIIEVAPMPRVSARDGAVSVNGTVVCFGLEDAPGFARDLRRALKGT